MGTNEILTFIGGIMLAIISYFLKSTMEDLKRVKEVSYQTKTKVEVLEKEYMTKIDNLNEKFDMLYDGIKDLTREINKLNQMIKQN
jgi:peptidoglycan hydrolase CwlO-like protein